MPKTHRQAMQRKLAQAYINMNWSAIYILELFNEYNIDHPELAVILHTALEGLDMVTDLVGTFGKEISGQTEIDWQAWAATGRPTHGIQTDEVEETTLPNTPILAACAEPVALELISKDNASSFYCFNHGMSIAKIANVLTPELTIKDATLDEIASNKCAHLE